MRQSTYHTREDIHGGYKQKKIYTGEGNKIKFGLLTGKSLKRW